MRKTIELTGTLTPDDLTPQMQDDFIALYRQWHADDRGEPPPGGSGGQPTARMTSEALTIAVTSLPSARPSLADRFHA